MKRKILISLLLVSFFNYIGCYSYYTLTEEERNTGRPYSDEKIKLILNDESEFEWGPPFNPNIGAGDIYCLKVDEPGRFLIGSGDMINKSTLEKSSFKGIVQGDMIDSSRIFIVDSEEYSVYWTKDGNRLSFKKGEFIEVLPEQSTGYYLLEPNGLEKKIPFDEIKEIQVSNINWYITVTLIAVGVAALIGLVIFGSNNPNFGSMEGWE
jgi:hypothetical protein